MSSENYQKFVQEAVTSIQFYGLSAEEVITFCEKLKFSIFMKDLDNFIKEEKEKTVDNEKADSNGS